MCNAENLLKHEARKKPHGEHVHHLFRMILQQPKHK